jgi:hypothetical protein
VNNCDIIPRASLANLLVFMDVLNNTIHDTMVTNNLIPNSLSGTVAFLQKISKGSNDPDLLLSYDAIQTAIMNAMNKLQKRHRDHLFVPGKVLLFMTDKHQKKRDGGVASSCIINHKENGGTSNAAELGPVVSISNTNREELSVVDHGNNDDSVSWIVTDCAEPVLRFFELDSFGFMTDHLTASYESSLQSVLAASSSTGTVATTS